MKTYIKQHALQLAVAAVLLIAAASGLYHPDPALGLAPLAMLMTTFAPFPVTPELTAVSLAYRNAKLIADEVLPRVPVGLQAFKYMSYPKGTFFSVPETKVGRKGQPNTVEFTGSEVDSSTQDHALDDEVPNADIENARNQPGMPDPLMRAAEVTTELLALAREKRAADLVFAAANYAAGNKVQLAGNDQWSSTHADSTPIIDITTALDACIVRPNVMVIGRAAFTKLAMHASIVKAYNGTAGDAGIVPRMFLAQLFELDEVLIGEGWINTAAKGQAPTLTRVWGKHCALINRNKLADTQRGTTFGFTAQWGARISGSEYDGKIGMRGGQRVRVGESVKELIVANDLGYFIEDAVA